MWTSDRWGTTLSKRSDSKVYIRENALIWVLASSDNIVSLHDMINCDRSNLIGWLFDGYVLLCIFLLCMLLPNNALFIDLLADLSSTTVNKITIMGVVEEPNGFLIVWPVFSFYSRNIVVNVYRFIGLPDTYSTHNKRTSLSWTIISVCLHR